MRFMHGRFVKISVAAQCRGSYIFNSQVQ